MLYIDRIEDYHMTVKKRGILKCHYPPNELDFQVGKKWTANNSIPIPKDFLHSCDMILGNSVISNLRINCSSCQMLEE